MSETAGVGPLPGDKTYSWELTKVKIEIMDSWFLMSSPVPVVIILASYLLFVLRVGPSYMEKRAPYQLKNTLILYNALQTIFAIFQCFKGFKYYWTRELFYSKCIIPDPEIQTELAGLAYIYFIAKVTELLDTVFFVLRKKNAQLTFLHIYHHSIMMAGTWVCMKYALTDHVMFGALLNCVVHVIMYSYYGLAAMGPGIQKYLWWKKYITRIQMTQFVIIFIKLSADAMVSECPLPGGILLYFVASLFLFFYLFFDFYRKEFVTKYKAAEKRLVSKSMASNGVEQENTKEEKTDSKRD